MVRQTSAQEKDTNIQVVVRCREAPTRGAKSSTSVIVPPIFGQDVKINGPPSVARSYHFDGVFGPKATQENIYDKVVSPILSEVMQGYNCTLFAYGQTGTGKTFTMEGDLEPNTNNNTPMAARNQAITTTGRDLLGSTLMSAQAGMIPRTLHNLFYALERQSAEFYVHVSYVELYNEELRDLLAGSDSDAGFVPSGNLRVYESGTDKGVVIQGLEERLVNNARDAVALMQAGAQRRKVAATRCNDTSSRSHAIFTITVFVRERAVTVDGEDVSKLGKLNLVDLAGSENIGRSGAQNVRAREAGSINKSLLVLGRVINALVEKSTYVPYRDSKLTHIIKDSLGGRTRTCMIATISNAVDHIEETIKTLQYASQAKGIRNRPVANKMVLKSEIVHDLQQHIERLNRDLEAARDTSGTGFYVSKDTYEELTTKERASREAVEEWKQRIALWEEEVQRTNEKHRATVEELQTTRRELGETSDALSASRVQLDLVQADLQRQTLLTRAHAHHERRLDATAHVLQSSLQLSTGDVQQLHARVSRMRDREQRNMSAAAKISELVGAEVERAQGAVGTYNEGAARQTQQLLHTLQSRVGPEFEAELGSRLREHAEALGADVARVLEAAAAQRDEGKGGCESAGSRVNELAAGLCASITGARMQGSEACAKLESHVTAQTAEQTVALGSMATAIRAILTSCSSSTAELLAHSQQRAQQVIDELRREADALRARHAEEIRILREQAQQLNKQARQEDDKLIDAVRSMIEERRAREEAAVGGLVDSAGTQADAHAQSSVRLIEQSGAICEALDHAASAVRSDIDKSSQGVESQLSACQSVHTGVVGSLGAAVSDHAEVIGAQLAAASEAASTAQSALGAAVQQSQQFVTSLNESSASSLDRVAQLASASLDAAQATSSKATGEWRAARTELDSLARTQASERDVFAGELGRGISSISTVVQRETSSGIQATQSSGSTPSANRRYRSIDSWNITRPHDEILDRLAGNGNDGPSFVDAESVEWTGMPTEHMDVECDKEESSKSMVVLSSSPIRPAFSSPIRPDSSLLRKRPSENAVSPASDPSMERPTRRPRTRQTIDGSTEHDGEESAIPLPITSIPNGTTNGANGASRLPMPTRRSRRTRG